MASKTPKNRPQSVKSAQKTTLLHILSWHTSKTSIGVNGDCPNLVHTREARWPGSPSRRASRLSLERPRWTEQKFARLVLRAAVALWLETAAQQWLLLLLLLRW